MSRTDGGPAFPLAKAIEGRDGVTRKVETNDGMSIRAWLAGQAITAALTIARQRDDHIPSRSTPAEVAAVAVEIADAMLAELEKQG